MPGTATFLQSTVWRFGDAIRMWTVALSRSRGRGYQRTDHGSGQLRSRTAVGVAPVQASGNPVPDSSTSSQGGFELTNLFAGLFSRILLSSRTSVPSMRGASRSTSTSARGSTSPKARQ